MGQPKITEIEKELADWEFLKQLPKQIDGFELQIGGVIEGRELKIASYVNEAIHCRLDLIYTSETFDYVPVKTIGMHTFRDMRYFYRDREKFAEMILQNIEILLEDVNRNKQHKFSKLVEEAGIINWDYSNKLPERIGSFELFVKPNDPIDYVNGSVIFIDYSDFANGNQLVFFYNCFRDEFFAETKIKTMPQITHDFDCKTIEALEILLEKKLQTVLDSLAKT